MKDPSDDFENLVERALTGDSIALAQVFNRCRERLLITVRLRLDRRLQARIDESDVLQDAYLDIARRLPEYAESRAMPFFLWMRFLTTQRLIDLHRQHLGAAMRDAEREVSYFPSLCPASTQSLAAQMVGRLTTASQAAMRAELRLRVQEALDHIDAIDREVLVLRHFEMLTNDEVAHVLNLKKAAASNRYIRALKRLKAVLESIPGIKDIAGE